MKGGPCLTPFAKIHRSLKMEAVGQQERWRGEVLSNSVRLPTSTARWGSFIPQWDYHPHCEARSRAIRQVARATYYDGVPFPIIGQISHLDLAGQDGRER